MRQSLREQSSSSNFFFLFEKPVGPLGRGESFTDWPTWTLFSVDYSRLICRLKSLACSWCRARGGRREPCVPDRDSCRRFNATMSPGLSLPFETRHSCSPNRPGEGHEDGDSLPVGGAVLTPASAVTVPRRRCASRGSLSFRWTLAGSSLGTWEVFGRCVCAAILDRHSHQMESRVDSVLGHHIGSLRATISATSASSVVAFE